MENNIATPQEIESLLEQRWLKHQDDIQKLPGRNKKVGCLYHFTTAEGLLGILSSNYLRATDINFLNDPSEMHYALEVLEECQKNLKQEYPTDLVAKLLDQSVISLQYLKIDSRPFVVCFCEDGSLLSQWRTYAANGTGFSIGFDKKDFGDKRYHNFELYAITHDQKLQRKLIEGFMREACEALLKNHTNINNTAENDIFGIYHPILTNWLVKCLVSFKNPLFEEEKEWRLVYMPRRTDAMIEKIDFIVTRGALRSHIKFSLDQSPKTKLPIKEIVFGPGHQEEKIEELLRWLISKYQDQSVIPRSYRDFHIG